jgi:hypothetical protein
MRHEEVPVPQALLAKMTLLTPLTGGLFAGQGSLFCICPSRQHLPPRGEKQCGEVFLLFNLVVVIIVISVIDLVPQEFLA